MISANSTVNSEIVKVTRKAASKIPRHSDDCFKSTLKSFLAVLPASFAYFSGVTARGDWSWRTDGATFFLTTIYQLWGFGYVYPRVSEGLIVKTRRFHKISTFQKMSLKGMNS
jgi:hypothetical protein